MFCLVKLVKKDVTEYKLEIHETIFPRPTPWKVAWKASLAFLLGRRTYCFVYIPPKYADLDRYDIAIEDDELVLRKDGEELHHAVVCGMAWQIWALYCVESIVYGPLLRFWEWRWAAGSGTLTRRELQVKLEELARRVDRAERKRRKTRRIEQNDE